MRVLELFAGTRSIGRAFEFRGHEVTSIDWDPRFGNCEHLDVGDINSEYVLQRWGQPDVIWA